MGCRILCYLVLWFASILKRVYEQQNAASAGLCCYFTISVRCHLLAAVKNLPVFVATNPTEWICSRCPANVGRSLSVHRLDSLSGILSTSTFGQQNFQELWATSSFPPPRTSIERRRWRTRTECVADTNEVCHWLLFFLANSFLVCKSKNNCRDYFYVQECFCFNSSVPIFQPKPLNDCL